MNILVKTSAALVFLASSSATAANLTIPMDFEYLALNGVEVETNLFSHKSDLTLSEGTHKIAIRYHDLVEDDFSDSQSTVKSSPFIITLQVDGDYQYQLSPDDSRKIVRRPQQFAKQPKVVITREDKGQVQYSVQLTDYKEESFITSLFNGNNKEDFIEQSAQATTTANSNVAVASVPVTATSVAVATAPKTVVSATAPQAQTAVPAATAPKAQAEQMLQYWWLQADEKTRKEFMSWAIKQL
ncbi:DUF2057 domain-containing protein [Shewanella maritima]|uniref:DUF2057 domain-containing protein n=1 Tax=Shewanella maritima TaxID=2520507 RepID=UPI00373541EC